MSKQVDIILYANFREEALYNGTCFENALLIELGNNLKNFPEIEDLHLLENEINKPDRTGHPQDYLHDVVRNNIEIDFEFSKGLNLFDTIYPHCFTAKTDLGKAVIHLLALADLVFILEQREWYSHEHLCLWFDVCADDLAQSIIHRHLKGENES